MKNYEYKVIMGIIVLLLFLSAHYLTSISYLYELTIIWMGIYVDGLIIDVFLCSGFILQIILILWIIRDEIKKNDTSNNLEDQRK